MLKAALLSDKTAHQTAMADCSSNSFHIKLEHDYDKNPAPEETENSSEGSVFLTINLTKYAKGVNLKDISGIVILLKDSKINPPIIINNINLHSSNESEDAVEDNNDAITSVQVDDPIPNQGPTGNEDKPCYKCKYCTGICHSKRDLKTHINHYHADQLKKYECKTCVKSYLSKLMLRRHRERVHFIHCGYCEKSYEKARDYKMHVKEKHTDVFYRMCKPFYCDECDKEISDKGTYLTHMRSHGGYVCNICGERSALIAEHKTHLDTHPDKFFCPKCNKGFKLKESLRAHDETHNDPYQFVCNECQKGFKTKTMLRQHLRMTHTTRERKYMCDQCPKMFLVRSHLVKHQDNIHAGIKRFECDQCGRKFYNSSNLGKHIEVMHLKLQPYQCEYCGKRFARKDYVVNHSKIHTKSQNEKETSNAKRTVRQPVECNICRKVFASALTLKHHLKYIHNGGVRKFKCRYCNLKFTLKTTRMHHEKLHKDPVNEFLCPICSKKMENKEELEAHMEEHNKTKN